MAPEILYLVYSALLAWLMLMTASLVRAQAWTPEGLKIAFGNRADLPPASAIAGRADRAARNMLENLVFFATLVFAANAAGVHDSAVSTGAQIFFFARVVYFIVYLAGIVYLRTAIWAVSIAGLVMILRAIL